MTNYFVDSTTGSDSDNGTTMDLAWATIEYAVSWENSLSASDIIWVRNIHSEIPTSSIEISWDGEADNPIQLIGWPRPALPNTTITQADFTQGSKIIDNVVGITIDRSAHINRYITAPDGKQYHISAVLWEFTVDGMASGDEFAVGEGLTNTTQTKNGKVWAFTDNSDTTGTIQAVVDSATTWANNDNITSTGGGDAELSANATAVGFLISSNYVGSTVTGTAGKFEIQEDLDYDLAQAINDSTWTIKKSTWNADADTLPLIDFNDVSYTDFNLPKPYWQFKNLEMKDSNSFNALFFIGTSAGMFSGTGRLLVEGCLFKQTTTSRHSIMTGKGVNFFKRIIIEGCNNTNQKGIHNKYGSCFLKDVCVYNVGRGLYTGSYTYMNNVNIGVEINTVNSNIQPDENNSKTTGKNVELGGDNGYITMPSYEKIPALIELEKFQKILGNHIVYKNEGANTINGFMHNVDIGDTNAPSTASTAGSTTDIAAFYPNVDGFAYTENIATSHFKWKIWASTSAETYTVYFQNNTGVTLNDTHAKENIWLKLTYIDSHNNGNITEKELFSTEIDIAQRASAADWDSLTIASHSPATAGWATLELFVSKYVASGQIYVDPKYV